MPGSFVCLGEPSGQFLRSPEFFAGWRLTAKRTDMHVNFANTVTAECKS